MKTIIFALLEFFCLRSRRCYETGYSLLVTEGNQGHVHGSFFRGGKSRAVSLKTTVLLLALAVVSTPLLAEVHLWRQAVEQVVVLDVDAGPFQEWAKEFDIIEKDGKAQVLIVSQDSDINRINDESIGPSKDIHAWVAIETEDTGSHVPVEGVEQTLPTMAWLKFWGGTTNTEIRMALAREDLDYEPIADMELLHNGLTHSGQVLLDAHRSFSWMASLQPPTLERVGFNHLFYERDGGSVQIQATVNVLAMESEGTVIINGPVFPDDLVPEGHYEARIHSFNPIWIQATGSDSRLASATGSP